MKLKIRETEMTLIVIAAAAFVILLGAGLALLAFAGAVGSGGLAGLPFVGKGCVALVPISGEIVADDASGGMFAEGAPGSETIANAIAETDKRKEVKAMVLLIDSPGGSVVAGNEIYRAVNSTEKPTVSYFREVAASAAYEIGAGSDYIVSDPDALTGSIGVRATVIDMSGLFEKLGVNMSVVKSGAMKDMGDVGRPMTPEEEAVFQAIVDEIFHEFRSNVIAGRGSRLNMAQFEKILDARVLTGRQAKEIGLVDELGTKQRAIEKAWEMGGGSGEPVVCNVNPAGSSFGGMFSGAAEAFGRGFASGLSEKGGVQIS